MNQPKNQKAEVLALLLKGPVTRRQVFFNTGILNLTARIADLRIRHAIDIKCNSQCVLNKHKRKISYGQWELVDKNDALLKYESVNQDD